MGFFRKKLSGTGDRSGSELNAFLGAGTEYSGSLDFVGTVRIDGIFDGEIASEGTLVLGKDAVIRGDINIGGLISNGQIYGNVTAVEKVVLQKHAVLEGSLHTKALVVEEGATIEGDVEMHGSSSSTLTAVDATVKSSLPGVDADSVVFGEEQSKAEKTDVEKVEMG